MYFEIVNEYKLLLNKENRIEDQLKFYPKGYIYKQEKGNKEYAYLKYQNGATVESTYIVIDTENGGREIDNSLPPLVTKGYS